MIESGKSLEHINQQLAVLSIEIERAGSLGLTNLHKHCENLVRRLLNRAYGYKLENLNEPVANVPGLDIGDETSGVAFQVSSDKTSAKVNDMLDKVIRFKHYMKFKKIKLFVLGEKQGSYTVDTTTAPHFVFDWHTDVIDFSDVIKKIQHFELEDLRAIETLLDEQLAYFQNKSKQTEGIDKFPAINVEEGMKRTNCLFFSHWAATIRINGLDLSAPKLLQRLQEFCRNPFAKTSLWLIGTGPGHGTTAKEVVFSSPMQDLGGGLYKQSVLILSSNTLHCEMVHYKRQNELYTNFIEELSPVVALIYFCKRLFASKAMRLEIDVDLSSNGRLFYMGQNSMIKTKLHTTAFLLNPSKLAFSKVIRDVDDESFIVLFEDVIEGFVSSEMSHFGTGPFLQIDIPVQKQLLGSIRSNLQPTLGEI